jgi:hypothetical protein
MHVPRFTPTLLFVAAWILIGPAAFGAKRIAESAGGPSTANAPQDDRARRVDELLAQTWSASGVEPAPPATDGEFLRRAYLDFAGVIPRVSEVREFQADDHPDKRARLIDRLLASPRYATHIATTWRNRILPLGEDPARTREALGLQKWLRTRFADNVRYDRIVGGLLLAGGENEFGPALYFQANDLAPEKLAGSAAELFLGVDLHCAQCHDHPFADWSQRDFWGLAAFFARVKSADGGAMAMNNNASYRLVDLDRGEVKLPESDEVVPPRFPGGDAASEDQWQSRRSQLVVWLTSRDNKMFARTAVNVAWEHLFGRKLVDHVDQIASDDASPPAQLLDELAGAFVDSGFDLQQLWRTLANTRAYQFSSQHDHPKAAAPELFARMLPKPLTPEQLYDSFLLLAPAAKSAPAWDDAAPVEPGVGLDEDPNRIEFVRRMRTPPGSPTQYRAGTLQALMLMNGAFTDNVSSYDKSSTLGALAAPFMTDDERIDSLFLATLARQPDADERAACLDELRRGKTAEERQRALSDVLWALLNSTEFAFNH